MLAHPVFADLKLHTDEELAEALGAPVVRRKTVHEWPLSIVQGVRLGDGRRVAYKSQLPPTVEPDFYRRASSPLLPRHQDLGRLGPCDTLALDWVDAPLLRELARAEEDLVSHGREVIARIGEIADDPPTYLDAGSEAAWAELAGTLLTRLGKLVGDGWFGSVGQDRLAAVRAWAGSAPVVAAVGGDTRLTHGDLKADQIFVTDDGYRVIDWQRPVLAPPEVDLVSLLVDRRIDPKSHVDAAVVGIFWFLRLHWAVEAQADLFPADRWPLFDQWAGEAVTGILE